MLNFNINYQWRKNLLKSILAKFNKTKNKFISLSFLSLVHLFYR